MVDEPFDGKEINAILEREVNRVFGLRKWRSIEQAEIATGVPASTIRRMRMGMSVKPLNVIQFGTAVGEQKEMWGLYALGLEPSVVSDVANQVQQLSPEVEEILEYIEDPQVRQAVRYFHGVPLEYRGAALASLAGMARYKDASEIARELEEEATVGKRANRKERPSVKPDEGNTSP